MDVLISGYVNHIRKTFEFEVIVCKDIMDLILSFYMHNLSQYKYVAVFCVINKHSYGHFSAFNIDISTDNIKKTHSIANTRCDIICNKPDIFHEEFGTRMTMFELNKFPEMIYKNLFPIYENINFNNHKNILHVVFRTEGRNESAPIAAYLLETDDKYTLPLTASPIDRSGLLQSHKYGLIALGGFKWDNVTQCRHVQVLQWDNDRFKWNPKQITKMNHGRANHSVYMFENEEKIFVCGGFAMSASTTEIYDFKHNKWSELKPMNSRHECHGLCYDNKTNNIYVSGDFQSNYHVCEKYDFHKNKWISLPLTVYPHRCYPDLNVNDNGILVCTGNHYKYTENRNEWGYAEFMDLRDSKQVWQSNGLSLYQMLKSGNHEQDTEFQHKTMRKIWSL